MPVELDHVSFSYTSGAGNVPALDRLCLKIETGEILGIMGRTGCGKTTLIQLIAGLLMPSSGRILINGEDINSRNYDRIKLRRTVGIVFQYPEYQLFETTVEKDVAFGLKHWGLPRNEIKERVRKSLETVGFDFDAIRSQSPLALSGGEKRRVAIAGVLAVRPDILIFDEPIAGLDPMGRDLFLNLVSNLNKNGATVIIVSHNADALAECSSRVAVLENGRIAADGPVKEVFSDIQKMERLHTGVSSPRLIADMLSRRGVPIPRDTVKYGELLAALKNGLSKGGVP